MTSNRMFRHFWMLNVGNMMPIPVPVPVCALEWYRLNNKKQKCSFFYWNQCKKWQEKQNQKKKNGEKAKKSNHIELVQHVTYNLHNKRSTVFVRYAVRMLVVIKQMLCFDYRSFCFTFSFGFLFDFISSLISHSVFMCSVLSVCFFVNFPFFRFVVASDSTFSTLYKFLIFGI